MKVCQKILEPLGYAVLAADSPHRALRLAESHAAPIHLLIADVAMPQMNGRELAGRILALKPGIKSLFMSGYTASVISHRGLLAKGAHFIQKPFSRMSLSLKVRAALNGE